MKFKSDFITNSSSTCYVVTVPEDFDLERCLPLIYDLVSPDSDLVEEEKIELKNEIRERFRELKEVGETGEGGYYVKGFRELGILFEDLGLCLTTIPVGDASGAIINFCSKRMDELLNVVGTVSRGTWKRDCDRLIEERDESKK